MNAQSAPLATLLQCRRTQESPLQFQRLLWNLHPPSLHHRRLQQRLSRPGPHSRRQASLALLSISNNNSRAVGVQELGVMPKRHLAAGQALSQPLVAAADKLAAEVAGLG